LPRYFFIFVKLSAETSITPKASLGQLEASHHHQEDFLESARRKQRQFNYLIHKISETK
jgi:hypothetical protein